MVFPVPHDPYTKRTLLPGVAALMAGLCTMLAPTLEATGHGQATLAEAIFGAVPASDVMRIVGGVLLICAVMTLAMAAWDPWVRWGRALRGPWVLAAVVAVGILLILNEVGLDADLSLRWPALAWPGFVLGLLWQGAMVLPDSGVSYNEEHGWNPPQYPPFYDKWLPERWQHEASMKRAEAYREQLRRRRPKWPTRK